ncbi:threonylcarbamoyl-AMP synthase [Alphaproteobacteria bacterium]|nr:threonylcarbamoyl-AMP synthase [Alphaproteobacteria bacterium]
MEELGLAVELLRRGAVVAAPTDTVYGLFADAMNDEAVQKVYDVKGRPSCNPLIAHVDSIEMAKNLARFSENSLEIARYFWLEKKLPLTIILPIINLNISRLATAGLPTIALRLPNHPMAKTLISMFGGPLAAPSANTSMSISPTSFEMVKSDLGAKIPMIIDGGACEIGLESTILDMSRRPYVILRPGGVIQSEIEEVLREKILTASDLNIKKISAPGIMKKHYSPNLPLRINAAYSTHGEAFIAFGETNVKYDMNLSVSGNLKEAARNLFSFLKKLDNSALYSGIAIMPIPNFDIGIAINDRIKRAAAKL